MALLYPFFCSQTTSATVGRVKYFDFQPYYSERLFDRDNMGALNPNWGWRFIFQSPLGLGQPQMQSWQTNLLEQKLGNCYQQLSSRNLPSSTVEIEYETLNTKRNNFPRPVHKGGQTNERTGFDIFLIKSEMRKRTQGQNDSKTK